MKAAMLLINCCGSQIVDNMKQGISEGFYRDDLPIDLVARLYVQKLEYINDPDFLNSEDFSFSNMFQVMFDNHIRGISNSKGASLFNGHRTTWSSISV